MTRCKDCLRFGVEGDSNRDWLETALREPERITVYMAGDSYEGSRRPKF